MKYLLILSGLLISLSSISQQNPDSVAVARLLIDDYKTLGNWNLEKHLQNCTSNYLLLENGELQTLADESNYFRKNSSRKIVRTDSFTFVTIRITDDIAYAVYTLYSTIEENNTTKKYSWLESCICRKINGRWKIELIHSTKKD